MIIKPDAVARRLTDKIIQRVKQEGFKICRMKTLRLSKQQAEEFYLMHRGKPFFNDLVEFISSGKAVVAVLGKEGAIEHLRRLIGATDPKEAGEGTIRRQYGATKTKNVIHASDSAANARREIEFFFKTTEGKKL